MKKELKFLLYIITIISFFIFVGKYYFSDNNKKKSYRSSEIYDSKLANYNDDLLTLPSNTEDIIENVESNLIKKKKQI